MIRPMEDALANSPQPLTRAKKDPEKAPGAANSGDQMGGFGKGLSVIEAYGRGRSSLTIAEVARLSGLDRASARRCLLTLVNRGYATTDGRYFELTPRVLRLGYAYLSASLPTLIQPTLDQLANTLGESCSASVLDGTEIVYIARAAKHRLIGVGLHAGSRLPAYCTSMGRVLLAALPSEDSRAILMQSDRQALTERTLVDVGHLVGELARVRADGYSIVDQEIEIGSMSISVPVRNMSGKTVAAIVVAVHATPAMTARLRTEILSALLEAQKELAEILP
jgi:IclR family transcriptional regulator, pca regulon regulatory protein